VTKQAQKGKAGKIRGGERKKFKTGKKNETAISRFRNEKSPKKRGIKAGNKEGQDFQKRGRLTGETGCCRKSAKPHRGDKDWNEKSDPKEQKQKTQRRDEKRDRKRKKREKKGRVKRGAMSREIENRGGKKGKTGSWQRLLREQNGMTP